MSCCHTPQCADDSCCPPADYDYRANKFEVWAVGDIDNRPVCQYSRYHGVNWIANAQTAIDQAFIFDLTYTSQLCQSETIHVEITAESLGITIVDGHTYTVPVGCFPSDAFDQMETSNENYSNTSVPVITEGSCQGDNPCHKAYWTILVTANAQAVIDGSITLHVSSTGYCPDGDFDATFPGVYEEGQNYSLHIGCYSALSTFTATSDQATFVSATSEIDCDHVCSGDQSQVVACFIQSHHVDALILLGNLVSTTYEDSVGAWYGSLKSGGKISAILGNMDWDFNNGTAWATYFNSPRYYKKTVGNTDFFMLDSGWNSSYVLKEEDGNTAGTISVASPKCCGLGTSRSGGSDQWAWFYDAVKASTAKFKVVCIHHPPWASGNSHWGESPEISPWGSHITLQWQLKELGIDLVLSADENNYERLEIDGVIYCVVGTGGATLTGFGSPPITGSEFRDSAHYGALQLTITNEHIYGRFIGTDGTILDSFTL